MDVNAKIDVGDNITVLLEKLAAQIGTTADKVFPWYVKQQVLEGHIWMSLSLSALFLGAILAIASWGKADFDGPGNRYFMLAGFGVVLFVFGFIFSVFGFIFSVFGAQGAITQIINPNYYALKSMTSDMAKLIGK